MYFFLLCCECVCVRCRKDILLPLFICVQYFFASHIYNSRDICAILQNFWALICFCYWTSSWFFYMYSSFYFLMRALPLSLSLFLFKNIMKICLPDSKAHPMMHKPSQKVWNETLSLYVRAKFDLKVIPILQYLSRIQWQKARM